MGLCLGLYWRGRCVSERLLASVASMGLGHVISPIILSPELWLCTPYEPEDNDSDNDRVSVEVPPPPC
jgi:hypothetical protein